MSKFSDEDRKRIMSEARRNIARERPVIDSAPPAPIKYRAIDNAIDEPVTEQLFESNTAPDNTTAEDRLKEFNSWIRPWWDAMTEVTKESIARVLDAERRQHQADLADEIRSLTIQLTTLQETVDELRHVLDAERRGNADVIDWSQATRRASN